MDPLSIASSIAGLVSLADVVFRSVYKYGKAVAGAKQEVTALSREINDLSSILRTLEALVIDLEDDGDTFNPALGSNLLGNCIDTLEKIKVKLKKATDNFQARSKFSGVARQLKWPFASSETKELVAEISRYKETMTLAVSSDSMRQLQLVLAKQNEHGKQIAALHTITKRVEINTQILINNEKRRVLDFFMPASINPQSNLEHNIRLRHPVTGMWLIESDDLTKWIQTPGSKLWLSGIPGGGKTVLAAAVIQEVLSRGSPKNGAAFFFCDYKNENTWEPSSILGAIASQLARQNDEAFDMLKAYFDTLHPERGLDKNADLDELRLTISRMVEVFDQVIVVIDGLDECGDQTDEVVDSIAEIASDSEQLTIALFSRNETNIRLRLEDDFQHIPVAASTGDIELFVGAEIQQRVQSGRIAMLSTVLKDEIRERLVEGANGMFRWVVCQLDYLGEFATDADRRHALHELPPTLHGSYMRLLERLGSLPQRIQLRVQMCLQFIASKDRKLRTIETLRQAVSNFASTGPPLVEKDTVSEREIEYRCSSLIRKSKEGDCFEFAHFSVKEFLESTTILENPKLAGYHISKHKYGLLLASQCLKLVHLSNVYEQKNGTLPVFQTENQEQGSFYDYACIMWPYVIREGLEDPKLEELSHSLISSFSVLSDDFPTCWKRLFTSAFAEYLRPRYSFGSKYKAARERLISQGQPGPWFEGLHLAAALNLPGVCLSLLKAGANPNHRCPYGTPMDMAMRGILALMPWESAWNEDEPQEMGWGNHSKYQKVIDLMVPAASQRNRTIDILIQAGSELSYDKTSALDLGKESIFSTVSVISCHTKNFTPIIRLLSLGIVPTDSEVDSLEGYLRHWILKKESGEDSQVRDRAILELLEYLDSAGAYDSTWGKRMGTVVWNVASAVGSVFTKERSIGIIDIRISLSKEGLVHQAFAAISRDDSRLLKTYLDDKRLDALEAYLVDPDTEATLVEVAVRVNALDCLEVLLELVSKEGNIHAVDPSDMPLIHICIIARSVGSLRTLIDHGVSPLAVDSDGITIFHLCASEFDEHDVNFLRDVLELDPHATATGLVTKTSEGEIPLDLLLLENQGRREVEIIAFELMDWCDKIPGFWSVHDQILQNAAAFGSAPVMRRLMELGAKPDPCRPSRFHPLHKINSNTTLECVKLLKSSCGDSACELRAESDQHLPAELYVMRCVKDAKHPDETIVQELLTPGVLVPEDPAKGTLWNFCCEIMLSRVRRWTRNAEIAYLNKKDRLMTQVLSMLLRLGCMHGYEEAYSQSALIPFCKSVLDNFGRYYLGDDPLIVLPNELGEIIQLVLDSTKYWDTAKTSPTTMKLFKLAIVHSHHEVVDLLLRRGVDVHQRSEGTSVIEFICQEPIVMMNNEKTEGTAMISRILDSTNFESLTNVKSGRNGLGLLHMMTFCDLPGSAWLMSELVKRGVNIEQECAHASFKTPLMYHLNSMSFDGAQILVELGASYGNRMKTDEDMDVPQLAAWMGAHKFLQFLLAHSANNPEDIVWDSKCQLGYAIDKDNNFQGGVTALHLAADGGHVDCLQLFFDEGLFKEFEPLTSHGWTPLHCAAWSDSHEAIEFLISKGADINALANDKSSPLHIAVRRGKINSTKTLIRLGAVSSKDFMAMSPKAYALKYSDTDLGARLKEAFGPQMGAIPDTIPWRGMKHVLQRLEMAIKYDDVDECKRLRNNDCPLDTGMLRCHGCSPLIASIRVNSTKVARWLLENGASTLKIGCAAHHGYVSEHATKTKESAAILPQILERNHDEGGDLVFGDEYPLHHAVYNKNVAAVELLLRHIEGKKINMGKRAQLDPEMVKSTIINRMCTIEDDDATPLHLAVQNEDLDMVSLLVENGAKLDALDEYHDTPLAYAETELVAIRLIELGASLGPLYENTKLFFKLLHCRTTKLSSNFSLDETMLSRFYDRYSELYATRKPPPMELVVMLAARGHDLTQDHGVGRSIMHDLICDNTSASLALHNADLGLHKTTPFPWHLWPQGFGSIAFLVTLFRHFRRLLSTHDFARILNLQPDRGCSPLCVAAQRDDIEMMDNCLEMGADIDFEGLPYGSALMIACLYGNLKSVSFLVRRGARTSYIGESGPVNVMDRTQSMVVRRWLLVGRFNEQKRILPAEYETLAGRSGYVRPWSGIRKARLKLTGSREIQPDESYLDYAERLCVIRKDMRGKIVPDLVE